MSIYAYCDNELGPFNGEYQTAQDAAKAAFVNYGKRKSVWVGEIKRNSAHDFIDGQSVLEDALCQATDEVGEWCEDWLNLLIRNSEKCSELQKLVGDWIEENDPVTFFTVHDVREITVEQSEDDGERAKESE
jgi:hypothetical protein